MHCILAEPGVKFEDVTGVRSAAQDGDLGACGCVWNASFVRECRCGWG